MKTGISALLLSGWWLAAPLCAQPGLPPVTASCDTVALPFVDSRPHPHKLLPVAANQADAGEELPEIPQLERELDQAKSAIAEMARRAIEASAESRRALEAQLRKLFANRHLLERQLSSMQEELARQSQQLQEQLERALRDFDEGAHASRHDVI